MLGTRDALGIDGRMLIERKGERPLPPSGGEPAPRWCAAEPVEPAEPAGGAEPTEAPNRSTAMAEAPPASLRA